MSKIILAVLTVAAFLYAAWLVLFGRRLPDPKQSAGVKRRFILATLLFVGLFGTGSVKGGQPKIVIKDFPPQRNPPMCYLPILRDDPVRNHNRFIGTLKAVWRTPTQDGGITFV